MKLLEAQDVDLDPDDPDFDPEAVNRQQRIRDLEADLEKEMGFKPGAAFTLQVPSLAPTVRYNHYFQLVALFFRIIIIILIST